LNREGAKLMRQRTTDYGQRTAFELRQIPKLELHVHLEGAMGPGFLRELSRRYGTSLGKEGEDLVSELYAFRTFSEFLNAYKVCCEHLKGPEDYGRLAGVLIQQLADQRCVYAEVFFTPSICKRFGLPVEEVIEAVLERTSSPSRSGVHARWIFDCVRQWGPDPCWQTLEWATRYQNRGVVGISIGGDEASIPARAFRDVFETAEKSGLHRTAHAGEICDARSVWGAIEELRAERIGHGIRALEDPMLVDYLKRNNLALDLSITSNWRTGAVSGEWGKEGGVRKAECGIRTHPIVEIVRAGIPFTVNTDDPGLLQTTLEREWELAAQILGWFPEQFVEMTRRTLGYAFLGEEERGEIRRLLM
jgi:adenosine deaminase